VEVVVVALAVVALCAFPMEIVFAWDSNACISGLVQHRFESLVLLYREFNALVLQIKKHT
jgi:hypothetical protein